MKGEPEKLEEPTWFVSDVHLYFDGADYLADFLRFLERAADEVARLYVVGDLFEFWIGNRQARLPFYRPLLDALADARRRGLRIGLVQGNRDFLLGRAFSDLGCDLLPDELLFAAAGQRVHVSHGDQFCIHDHSYQAARSWMRSAPARFVAACLPAGLGVWLARSYRGISERKKARMSRETGNRFHTIEDGVRREFAVGGHDLIICGHIHDFADRRLTVEGRERRVISTGAWEEGPNYVAFDGKDFRPMRFEAAEVGPGEGTSVRSALAPEA